MELHEIKQLYDFSDGCWRHLRRRPGCMAGRPRPVAGPLLAAELSWRVQLAILAAPRPGCPTPKQGAVLASLEASMGSDLFKSPSTYQAALGLAESVAREHPADIGWDFGIHDAGLLNP